MSNKKQMNYVVFEIDFNVKKSLRKLRKCIKAMLEDSDGWAAGHKIISNMYNIVTDPKNFYSRGNGYPTLSVTVKMSTLDGLNERLDLIDKLMVFGKARADIHPIEYLRSLVLLLSKDDDMVIRVNTYTPKEQAKLNLNIRYQEFCKMKGRD